MAVKRLPGWRIVLPHSPPIETKQNNKQMRTAPIEEGSNERLHKAVFIPTKHNFI